MPEKMVMVGMLPETVVIDPGDQVSWLSNAGNLKIEFDSQRCPFSSNVFQAPPGVRLSSGPSRPGSVRRTPTNRRVRKMKTSIDRNDEPSTDALERKKS